MVSLFPWWLLEWAKRRNILLGPKLGSDIAICFCILGFGSWSGEFIELSVLRSPGTASRGRVVVLVILGWERRRLPGIALPFKLWPLNACISLLMSSSLPLLPWARGTGLHRQGMFLFGGDFWPFWFLFLLRESAMPVFRRPAPAGRALACLGSPVSCWERPWDKLVHGRRGVRVSL